MVRKFVNYHGKSFEMWGSREAKYVHFEMAVFLQINDDGIIIIIIVIGGIGGGGSNSSS